jgi:hypothetical protein
MAKSYRYSNEDDVTPVDVHMRKRMSAKRYRDRVNAEFQDHQMSQSRDKRVSLPVTRYREED